jgi:hypothetical protein
MVMQDAFDDYQRLLDEIAEEIRKEIDKQIIEEIIENMKKIDHDNYDRAMKGIL